MKALAPNTLLQNRYLIVHLIGKGGMGEVYLAVDQRLGSAVALKRTKFSDDEMLGNAFEREARILARLRHSVLPKVSDHFIEQDNQYLIMEHISGDDLAKRLEINKKPFPLSWVLFWADQLLDALSYLHSHEPPIIHRDIKPQNLKLTDDNNIILLDFGLSKNSVGITNVTSSSGGSSGSVVGYTPHYAPMEQIRGTGTSPRSDIYALSATIYQLLTNSVPSDALTRADALLSGYEDPLQALNEINAEVSKNVSDIILKGMSVSQDQRFASAREMQKELRDAYAQLQSAMAAQTIVFNAQSEPLQEGSQPLQQKLEKIATPELETGEALQSGIQTQVIPAGSDSGISQGNGNSYVSPPANQEPNFDATIPYGISAPADSLPKQSDVRTEVFSGDFGMDAEPVLKSDPVREENFDEEESYKTEANFSPDVTIPLLSFDSRIGENKPAETANKQASRQEEPVIPQEAPSNQTENYYFPEEAFSAKKEETPVENYSKNENYAPPEDNYSPAVDYSKSNDFSDLARYTPSEEERYYSQPETPQPEQQTAPPPPVAVAATPAVQKKSSGGGKAIAIIGGLAALLFLAVAAAGLGWYLFKDSGTGSVTNTTTTPSPQESVTSTPTPQEIFSETNTDTNSVTNEDVTNTNTNVETNNQQEITKTDNSTTNRTKTVPTPQQQQTPVKPTPRQTQVGTTNTPVKPVPTQTPVKPTPKKTDRTVILQ